jgi:hypothetical protein
VYIGSEMSWIYISGEVMKVKYKLVKTLSGKARVKYECPYCSEVLENELTEAGNTDNCPACKRAFEVPGLPEKRLAEEQLRTQQLEQKRKTEAAKRTQLANQQAEEQRKQEEKQQQLVEQWENAQKNAQREEWIAKNRAPYEYRTVRIVLREPLTGQVEELLNREAESGWEFYSLEMIRTYRPPGCIVALLGIFLGGLSTGTVVENHFAVFRKHVRSPLVKGVPNEH